LDVLGRVEAREVLADDFPGLVPLDALGPGVPGQDQALRAEQEDGVVPDALDEAFEAFLTLAQQFLTRVVWFRPWAHSDGTPVMNERRANAGTEIVARDSPRARGNPGGAVTAGRYGPHSPGTPAPPERSPGLRRRGRPGTPS